MRKISVAVIFVLVLLVALNCGCTSDDGGNGGNGDNEQETGIIKINFHVESVDTTGYELYVDTTLVQSKSSVEENMIYTYRNDAYPGAYEANLIYYYEYPTEDWLTGETVWETTQGTHTEKFTLSAGQEKIIDWYDDESGDYIEPEYGEKDEYEEYEGEDEYEEYEEVEEEDDLPF